MTTLKQLRSKLEPTPEIKLRSILENMDAKELAKIHTMTPDDHDAAVISNGLTGLTRQDLARLIGMAYKDTGLTYRLAKLLVDLNRQ